MGNYTLEKQIKMSLAVTGVKSAKNKGINL